VTPVHYKTGWIGGHKVTLARGQHFICVLNLELDNYKCLIKTKYGLYPSILPQSLFSFLIFGRDVNRLLKFCYQSPNNPM